MVPAGGSAMVDFKMEVPGTYVLARLLHFRAFNKGALGMLKAEGAEAEKASTPVRKSTLRTSLKRSDFRAGRSRSPSPAESGKLTKEEQVNAGRVLFLVAVGPPVTRWKPSVFPRYSHRSPRATTLWPQEALD